MNIQCNKTIAKYIQEMHYDPTPFLHYNKILIDNTLDKIIIQIDIILH